jgi:energy-coupling factor transporter ATP-binding protein EcfA2
MDDSLSDRPVSARSSHVQAAEDEPLVSPEEVLNAGDIGDIFEICCKLGVSCKGVKTVEKGRERIINHLKEVYGRMGNAGPPVNAATKAVSEDFAVTKDACLKLIAKVEDFVGDSEILPWLEKLSITGNEDIWLHLKDFHAITDSLEKQPAILVAGSTSSGKSTFINALLGEDILPTDYNAATSVLCEIKYTDENEPFAFLHRKKGSKQREDRVYLNDDRDRKKFKDAVSPPRQPEDLHKTVSYLRVEIFLRIEFLKYVTLVDSPGATENSALRRITEQCQQDMACGFIYVLDAGRAAEEASQVCTLHKFLYTVTCAIEHFCIWNTSPNGTAIGTPLYSQIEIRLSL